MGGWQVCSCLQAASYPAQPICPYELLDSYTGSAKWPVVRSSLFTVPGYGLEAAVARNEMPRILGAHDALVVPTVSPEPLARIVIEGMACGLTVLASRVGGTPEMIDHGHDGFLFAPSDSYRLSELLQRLADEPALRERLGAAARVTSVVRFDIQRMVDEIEQYLEEVLVETRRPC